MRSLAPIGLIIAFGAAIVLAGPAPDRAKAKASSRACCPTAMTQCADRVSEAKGADCPMAKGDCPMAKADCPMAKGDCPKAKGDCPMAKAGGTAACADCPRATGDCPCPGGNCADCKVACPRKADCLKSGAQCAVKGKACRAGSAPLQPGTAVMKCGGGTRAIGAARLTSATKCVDNRGKRDYLPALQCATYFK